MIAICLHLSVAYLWEERGKETESLEGKSVLKVQVASARIRDVASDWSIRGKQPRILESRRKY
jgi:hypothetical protein